MERTSDLLGGVINTNLPLYINECKWYPIWWVSYGLSNHLRNISNVVSTSPSNCRQELICWDRTQHQTHLRSFCSSDEVLTTQDAGGSRWGPMMTDGFVKLRLRHFDEFDDFWWKDLKISENLWTNLRQGKEQLTPAFLGSTIVLSITGQEHPLGFFWTQSIAPHGSRGTAPHTCWRISDLRILETSVFWTTWRLAKTKKCVFRCREILDVCWNIRKTVFPSNSRSFRWKTGTSWFTVWVQMFEILPSE